MRMRSGLFVLGVSVAGVVGACTVTTYPPLLQPVDASVPDGALEAGGDGSVPDGNSLDATLEAGSDATLDADGGSTDADDGSADADGGADADDGSADAAPDVVTDASLDGGVCLDNPLIDPTAINQGAGAQYPLGSFGCKGSSSFYKPRAVPFTITKTQVVSYGAAYHLSHMFPEVQIRKGCNAGAIVASASDCTSQVVTLSPGDYTFVDCEGIRGSAGFWASPVPVGNNTSCNGAVPIPYTEPNPILDGNPRYYKFIATANFPVNLEVSSNGGYGQFTYSVEGP